MTASDFTSYLGKEVSFLVPKEKFNTRHQSEILIKRVTGTVGAIMLFDPLEESEFLIKENDEFYWFSEVMFIQDLPNPLKPYPNLIKPQPTQ